MSRSKPPFEGVSFVEGSAHRIAEGYWKNIRAIRKMHYLNALQSRTPEEVNRFVDATSQESWANPNLSTNARSRYAKPIAVAAFRGNHMTSYVLAANNVSSPHDGIVGTIEEQAKLHVPFGRFLEARHVAIREIAGAEDPVILAGMTAHILCKFNKRQPVTAYVYQDEDNFRALLDGWQFDPDGEPEELIDVYGQGTAPEYQQRLRAESAEQVFNVIWDDEQAREAIALVSSTVVYDSGSGTNMLSFPVQL